MGLASTRVASRSGPDALVHSPEPSRAAAGSPLGCVVGSYRLVTELGQGGMGTVYYAEHVTLARRAAVKVLIPEVARSPEIVARFFDEARAVNRIRHPGIVDVFDLGTQGETHYLVMELLEGETLGAQLERTPRLRPEDAVALLRQACDALAAAHERGIVHRDLKPENLFITNTPRGPQLKVLDFGIAKLIGHDDVRRTKTGFVLGTPTYMSPEQCLGERDLDARSDVYSLGVVAFEALTGRPPFVADSVGRLIVAHTSEVPPLASTLEPCLPAALVEVVARALSKRRDERFATMRELSAALEAALVPRVPANLALVREAKASTEAAPSSEEIVRIEIAQTRTVGARLREIIHARLASDRLPLPSMPLVVVQALELLRSEQVGLARVARTLETDPLIVPAILKVANSAAYGSAVPIASLDVAVARLGVRSLRTLLTENATRELFRSRDPAIARSFRCLWEHCVAVGTLSRALAVGSSVPSDEVYLAGLLHDVGKPVVGVLLLETERSLLAKLGVSAIGGSLWMRIVEDCHAEVGATLAARWRLPPSVVGVIASGPELREADELSSWLAYGHALAASVGHTGGLPVSDDAGDVLARARDRMGGKKTREDEALASLAEVLTPSPTASRARAATRATVPSRRR